mgnify:CR=1 FL=1
MVFEYGTKKVVSSKELICTPFTGCPLRGVHIKLEPLIDMILYTLSNVAIL